MRTLQHTPSSANTFSSARKDVFINIICALAVMGVVLMLYVVNAHSKTENTLNNADSAHASSSKVMANGKSDNDDGWATKLLPLRLIHFTQ